MARAASQFSSQVFIRSQGTTSPFVLKLNSWSKRAMDIVFSLLGLFLLAPLFLVISILIKRECPGPSFYRGRRIGLNGREFKIVKFRTMQDASESNNGPAITARDDPRVTRFGKRLRDSKLNELPQLWNVLKGDMSLVGPRPEDPDIVTTWTPEERREVLSVRPGITSPASIVYRDEESLLSQDDVMQTYLQSVLPSKLRLDQLYVRHRSFWLDLDLLFWTVFILVPQLGSFAPAEEMLFLGPLSKLGRRYINWFVIDTLITLFAIGITGVIWRTTGPLDIGWAPSFGIALGFAFLFSLMGSLMGMGRIEWSRARASDAVGLLASAVMAGMVALIVNQAWWSGPLLPPMMIATASGVSFVGFVAARYRSRLISGLAHHWLEGPDRAWAARERVLIVGGGSTGQFVAWLLTNHSSASAFHIVGYADDDLYKQGIRFQGISVIGRRADIPRLVKMHDVGIVIFAIHNIGDGDRDQLLEICQGTDAKVVLVPDILGTLTSIVSDKRQAQVYSTEGDYPASSLDDLPTSEGIPLAQAQNWLVDLERLAEAGDLAAVKQRIRSIRGGIQGVAPQQRRESSRQR